MPAVIVYRRFIIVPFPLSVFAEAGNWRTRRFPAVTCNGYACLGRAHYGAHKHDGAASGVESLEGAAPVRRETVCALRLNLIDSCPFSPRQDLPVPCDIFSDLKFVNSKQSRPPLFSDTTKSLPPSRRAEKARPLED